MVVRQKVVPLKSAPVRSAPNSPGCRRPENCEIERFGCSRNRLKLNRPPVPPAMPFMFTDSLGRFGRWLSLRYGPLCAWRGELRCCATFDNVWQSPISQKTADCAGLAYRADHPPALGSARRLAARTVFRQRIQSMSSRPPDRMQCRRIRRPEDQRQWSLPRSQHRHGIQIDQ